MQNIKEITVNGTTVTITDSSGQTVTFTAETINMPNLPTSDPGVAGQLYSDSNVVTVSAG